MKVLVACEYSGKVRDAFLARGHDAYSCDLLPADDGKTERHYRGDMFDIVNSGNYDLVIMHPPCTALAVSGNRWYSDSPERETSLDFVRKCMAIDCGKWAIENPVGVISSAIRKPDQYIQPWQFGHGETKKTGLWLHGLPALVPTDIVAGREQRIWKMGPSVDRWKLRSETYQGIADAMAEQWGGLCK